MIAVDTNVASEQFKPRPALVVAQWFQQQDEFNLYLPSTAMAEILVGIARLPDGKRKGGLLASAEAMFDDVFKGRVLPFDRDCATAFAELSARAARLGRPVSLADAQIAAIAAVRGFAVATRDTAPFLAMGLRVIDPWQPDV